MDKYAKINPEAKIMFKCDDPITLDKSLEWGEGNVQVHKNGAWIQLDNNSKVSHLVADENGSPVGWGVCVGPNIFTKKDVFAMQTAFHPITLTTLDGVMVYENPTKDGWILYNEENGKVNFSDGWFMTNEKFISMYKKSSK